MEDTEITEARNKSFAVRETKRKNGRIINRSDRVHWQDIKSDKPSRIRTGVVVNIRYEDLVLFLDDAYFLINARTKNALKKHNEFKICTVLCVDFNSKTTTTEKYIKNSDMTIDRKTDIESWFDNNVEKPIVNKLKQLQANNRRMQLDIICLMVCFANKELIPKKLQNNGIVQINNRRCPNAHNNANAIAGDVIFYHQNMQSIMNKIEKLENLAHSRQFVFILVTEHWITANHEIPKIDEYDWISTYRRTSRNAGGGAGILVSKCMRANISPRTGINRMSESKVIELAACLWQAHNLVILALYRPPNGSIPTFLETLERVLENVMIKNNFNLIIGGDFNIDFSLKDDSVTKRLMKLLSTFNLHIKIHEYTRVRLRTKKCIDNIITNLPNVVARVVDADISDHFGQEMILQCKSRNNNVLRGKVLLNI